MSTNDLQKILLDWTLDLDIYAKAVSFQFYNPEITLFYRICEDYHIVRKIAKRMAEISFLRAR